MLSRQLEQVTCSELVELELVWRGHKRKNRLTRLDKKT